MLGDRYFFIKIKEEDIKNMANLKEVRIGVIGIVIENRRESASKVNQLLSDYGHIIVGRMGIPYRERDISVISIIVDGTTDEIGALTGRIGSLPGVNVRSALSIKKF